MTALSPYRTPTRRPLIPFAGLLLSLVGCQTVQTSGYEPPAQKEDTGPWLSPSPLLREQIQQQVERLPWTHGAERIDQIRWFAGVGEPVYPYLLELCADPRPAVAGSALAALGATGDSRLVEPIHAVDWPADLAPVVELERARTLVRLGDWRGIPTLVEGLGSAEMATRALSIHALQESTGERMGFEPRGPEAERIESIVRWNEWIERRAAEGLVAFD